MIKLKGLREAVRFIESAGATDLRVEAGSRHLRVHFRIEGEARMVSLHKGGDSSHQQMAAVRSATRRKPSAPAAGPSRVPT